MYKTGVVKRFHRDNPMDGLTKVIFTNDEMVYVESSYGLRAMASAVGGNLNDMIGKEISYNTDDFGILESFDFVIESA
jgi:hypothetical protein